MIETFMNMDAAILIWIQEKLRFAGLNPVFIGITTIGNGGIIWLLGSASLLLSKKTRKIGVMSLYAIGIAFVLNNMVLKNLVGRARPFDVVEDIIPLISRPTDFSFPSGHTASAFACAWLMLRKLPKKYGIPAVILAALMGFSRMYVGVHYLSDVLVGAGIGIFGSYLSEFILGTLFFQLEKGKNRK